MTSRVGKINHRAIFTITFSTILQPPNYNMNSNEFSNSKPTPKLITYFGAGKIKNLFDSINLAKSST